MKKREGITVAEYEYLISKVNELVHQIDMAKKELAGSPDYYIILNMEKTLMELEARIEHSTQRN